tara:strand:- start:550 stop:1644 length:1095 start_codon:yes stop_codon:yes gene_type:complete
MKNLRPYQILFNRFKSFKELLEIEHAAYGFAPNYKPMKPFFKHLDKIGKKIEKIDRDAARYYEADPKKRKRYEIGFLIEMHEYTNKIFLNGCYYSTKFLQNLYGLDRNLNSQLKLLKYVKYSENARIDTLMGFTIMRARLEEMVLNLFFIFKAKNLIKEKKWYDLFVLIHRVNYSNYQDEIGLKIKPQERRFKKFLDKILKKNNKLHISEMTKYVVNQKKLKDDFHPDFYNINEEKIDKKELLRVKMFQNYLKKNEKLSNSSDYFSMKEIDKIYSLLSDELHPNNLFLRNIMTSSKSDSELSILLKKHIEKLLYCSTYITDTLEIVYKQTFGILEFFLNKFDGSEKDKNILNGFRQQVEKKISI